MARVAFIITALLVFSWIATAGAQTAEPQVCAPRAEIVNHLGGAYHEKTVAVGIADNGTAVFEILTSAEGATWTLLYSLPNGTSCLVATGQDWQTVPALAQGPEA